MPLIRPFAGLRPLPEYAKDVVAPPYDVLSSAEARQLAFAKPWNFLHVSKAEIDLAEDIGPYDSAVYSKAAKNLTRMVTAGILVRDHGPRYYVYRLTMGDHIQTGLVAVASVKDYGTNRIRKHELTRPAKEDDRMRHITALKAQTGPVLLVYKSNPMLDNTLNAVTHSDPVYDLVADDGIGHALWVIDNPTIIEQLTKGFDAMDALYIADGHHRSAAGSRVAAAIDDAKRSMSDYILSVIFPHNQMKILAYNRVVTDLHGLAEIELVRKIKNRFRCIKESAAVSPRKSGEFGMYLGSQWYRLNINAGFVPNDPVGRLDVSLLADNLLDPLLGISDPRTDHRIDFVGGIRGLDELQRRVDGGEMAVAFSMFPTQMEDLMAVADAHRVMPPKSTWFEPKLADGLVSHVLD